MLGGLALGRGTGLSLPVFFRNQLAYPLAIKDRNVRATERLVPRINDDAPPQAGPANNRRGETDISTPRNR